MNLNQRKISIIIPARYSSSRFPGKPLHLLNGISMVQRVYNKALKASKRFKNISVFVATDNELIKNHVEGFGGKVLLTPANINTGSDRAFKACENLQSKPDYIINLQGDAPLTPVSFIEKIIDKLISLDNPQIVTPVTNLKWAELDALRESKKTTPFSGTTVIINSDDKAIWFSKNIIPAIRGEDKLRKSDAFSPVFKHVGLYGYSYNTLEKFINLSQGKYELIEELEQLRLLENKIEIDTVKVDYGSVPQIGVDTIEDANKVENILKDIE